MKTFKLDLLGITLSLNLACWILEFSLQSLAVYGVFIAAIAISILLLEENSGP